MSYTVYKSDFKDSIKNLCVYCIYLHTPTLPRYIVHYIKSLQKIGYETIVVSHSEVNEEGLRELEKISRGVILKENFGYDFFAWRQALEIFGKTAELDSLLLTNDSIVGPFSDLGEIFRTMNLTCDFWGLTENFEHKYHIQSYFLHANKKTIATDAWENFWNDLKLFENKLDFVKNYEVNLTQTLAQNPDIKIGSWITSTDLSTRVPLTWFSDYPKTEFWYGISNPTIRFWKELILYFRFPFIKKNLFFGKEHYHVVQDSNVYEYKVFPVNWKKIISKTFTQESISLIEEHILDYNTTTTKFQHKVTEKYKLLFVFKEFGDRSQSDYLLRLLNFFNAKNIETEVIIFCTENNVDDVRIASLRDLTKLTFFDDLTTKQANIHQHQLATEKIGTIIIGDANAAKFAAKFAYINCPYILMANNGLSDIEHLKMNGLDIKREGLFLMTHSKKIKELLKQKGFESFLIDPVPLINNENQSRRKSIAKPLFTVGFIGLFPFELHHRHIENMVACLLEKEEFQVCLLFLQPEYNSFMEFLKKNHDLFPLFFSNNRCKIVVYDNINKLLRDQNIDLFISYENSKYLSNTYIDAFNEGKPLLSYFQNAADAEIFDCMPNRVTLGYFNTPDAVNAITALKNDIHSYELLVKQQTDAFRQYTLSVFPEDAEYFFLNSIIDFSELKSYAPKITVIFHFHFYSFDESSFLYYKRRLREFCKPNVNFLFSITEDSHEIPVHTDSLKQAFPNSVIKLVPNKGRDIGAKFLLLDYFVRHDGDAEYVVILHDKKSLHLPYSEARAWIDSLLKIIEPKHYSSIINSFSENEKLGILGSSERIVDCILRYESNPQSKTPVFEWNNDLLHHMISLYNIRITDYNFVGGTMFWIRAELVKELNEKYNFLSEYQKLEEGNVMDNNGSTITHCWERLFCWLATNSGYQIGRA